MPQKEYSKKAYQLVKDQTTEKQGKSQTIQDKSRKCLTEENEILNRWTEYCSDLYNPVVLDCPQIPDEEHHPILREKVESAVKVLKMGKSAGVDNIPAELAQAGGVSCHQTSKERQLAAVPELQTHQPYQPS